MKILKCLMLSVMVAAFVSACSSDDKEATGVIPESQLKALEKAQSVEDLLKSTDEARKEQLEEVGG